VLLSQTSESVQTIARQVGFNDGAYFSRVFRKQTGTSPQAFRDAPPAAAGEGGG
jgi:AraC-like DNA-binding protein